MPNSIEHRGFFMLYDKPVNRLITSVSVLPLASKDKSIRDTPVELKALWDTGATKTCIKPALKNQLNLQMFRLGTPTIIHGVGGKVKADFTIVNMFLAYNILIEYCQIFVLDFPGSSDIIIGTDIIKMGDFAISNVDEKTSFSFAMPPFPERINFAKKSELMNQKTNYNIYMSREKNTNVNCI